MYGYLRRGKAAVDATVPARVLAKACGEDAAATFYEITGF